MAKVGKRDKRVLIPPWDIWTQQTILSGQSFSQSRATSFSLDQPPPAESPALQFRDGSLQLILQATIF